MIKQSVSTVFRGLKRLRFANSYSAFTKSVKRNVYAIMVAFALGMSNVMFNETRMANDSKTKIEQTQSFPDSDG